MYYSCSDPTDSHHRHGVAIVLDKNIRQSVTDVVPISEIVKMIKMAGKPLNINVVQVYASTADKSEEEISDFYKK